MVGLRGIEAQDESLEESQTQGEKLSAYLLDHPQFVALALEGEANIIH